MAVETLVATTSGSARVKNEDYSFVEGVTRIRSDHPLAKAHPDFFTPAEDNRHYDVEEATAAPTEKRGARK